VGTGDGGTATARVTGSADTVGCGDAATEPSAAKPATARQNAVNVPTATLASQGPPGICDREAGMSGE
jgi:hypothetical protein